MSLKPFIVKSEEVIPTANPHLTIINSTLIAPTGDEVVWGYIKTHAAAVIFAVDDMRNVYLKKEWRLGRKDFVWELPAGFIEQENPTQEQIKNAANRELQEEIGVKARSLEKLITVYPSNYMTMLSHIYFATGLEKSKLPGDKHEYLEVKKLPIQEAYELITNTQIPNSQTMIAFAEVMKKLKM